MDCSIGGLHWGPLIYGNYHIDLRDIKLISPKDLLISLHILSGPPHSQGDLVSRLVMGYFLSHPDPPSTSPLNIPCKCILDL